MHDRLLESDDIDEEANEAGRIGGAQRGPYLRGR